MVSYSTILGNGSSYSKSATGIHIPRLGMEWSCSGLGMRLRSKQLPLCLTCFDGNRFTFRWFGSAGPERLQLRPLPREGGAHLVPSRHLGGLQGAFLILGRPWFGSGPLAWEGERIYHRGHLITAAAAKQW